MSDTLLGPQEIRQLAQQLEVTPTKKWGQNFLLDPNTIRRIVAAAEVGPADRVIEVGPGLGSLTLGLVGQAAQVTAVEIDPRLAGQLPKTVAERDPAKAAKLAVVEKDALKITAGELGEPTALVANLPYNVAVPVLLHLLAAYPSIERVLVMVQLEVAQRLAAQPGSKIYGVPSVKASFYGKVRQAGTIGRNVFWPAPNIESGLVRIDCYRPSQAPWPVTEEARAKLWPVVDAAFAQRRKTLRASLSGHFGSANAAEEALRAAGIDPRQRGEKLGVEDFARLAGIAGQTGEAN
ncbi:16S rRNA (adenine(1518)-N(6)/adenine(1519)-N(6))-dimethyltransferase RsmA [Corynebacterium confusum]|uniref:16S rRNA (adenine(1518)-N(6)/adenine(1519)-N(6))- dimethyltransferase RsmA n=1 Tax=uncultured Corynebacterium sp. TaxID=159447 RepID=UPI0025E4C568|nr:16S rRNA (adenine(1518)-N(6)/adenine(1519)-N(6))-dimethyltransferase RsmA [uncultured Corynebacterium sp.]